MEGKIDKVFFEEPIYLDEYGVFNGVSTMPNRNREERREYIKEHKNDKDLNICPSCRNKARRITDDNSNWFCELCGKLIKGE